MKTRKILSVILCLCLIYSSIALGVSAIDFSADHNDEIYNISVPDGYYLTGREFTDEQGKVYYYIREDASDSGLSLGMWIDENGNEVTETTTTPPVQKCPPKKNYPSRYDARDDGIVPTVTNQGETGTCWAHSAVSSLEISSIKQGFTDVDSTDGCEF